MKRAIILQGWYQKPESNFYPWLKKELEKKEYEVFLPNLPTMHTDMPDMQQELDYIEQNVQIDDETIIFGHSIGCLLAMRLAEKHRFAKMFLIAGWDFDDLTAEHQLFWPNKLDHKKIQEHVKEIYCISGDKDSYFTPFTVEEMSKRLGGKFILVKGAGHFLDEQGKLEIPEIVQYL